MVHASQVGTHEPQEYEYELIVMKKGASTLLHALVFLFVGVVSFELGATLQRDKDDTLMRQLRAGIIPEPEYCYLCNLIEYDAPCVIRLSTGQVSTLRVFEPKDGDYALPDLNTNQSIRRMSFWANGGVTYVTHGGVCDARIEKSTVDMNEGYYCNSCRELIRSVATEGYVLADNLNPGQITLYPLTASAFSLRDYNIAITENGDYFRVIVTSERYEPDETETKG